MDHLRGIGPYEIRQTRFEQALTAKQPLDYPSDQLLQALGTIG